MIDGTVTKMQGNQEETKLMKAIIHTKYGPPEVLELQDAEKPVPADDRVVVRVHASSLNPADTHLVDGKLFFRLMGRSGIRRPKDPKFGTDLAGEVYAIGKNVTQFKPGDEVYGVGRGACAEYADAREDRLAIKPSNSTFEEAAAVPIAGFTALQALRDHGHVQPGQRVLVNGASGGVGTFLVQIAKSYDAEVTGVCSTKHLDLVRSIGADHVIDYTREDFTRNGERYDLICDAVGNRSVSDYKRILKPGGTCVMIGFSGISRFIRNMVGGKMRSKIGKEEYGFFVAKSNQKDLIILKELIEARKIRPVIDRRYPLGETANAVSYVEGPNHKPGHAGGKVVITVGSDLKDNPVRRRLQ
jgi:NADPH:quinone reductase-like Zn-dependent oxidoreductase